MKIRSLLLGSIATVAFSAGAFAADPPGSVLTSLDVCDALGISGLTISSDTNCLAITGEVTYEFSWGDYEDATNIFGPFAYNGDSFGVAAGNGQTDWESTVEAWLKFVATADSDFGPAKAVIKLDFSDASGSLNGVPFAGSTALGVDEAYVSIGDSTVLMAGLKGSIANLGDDEPFNFLGMFNSDAVNDGVGYNTDFFWPTSITTGGHVIQLVSDLGNGLSVGGALEDLNGDGTAVGVVSYAGGGLSAHVTFLADDILDGLGGNDYAVHAGFTAVLDQFQLRGAVAANDDGWWNVLGTASATFDMFTIAGSVEATAGGEFGFGTSVEAEVTDGVAVNLGFRWFDPVGSTAGYQVAAQLVADVSESLSLTGEVGYYSGPADDAVYGIIALDWNPGGGFTSSVAVEANTEDAYKLTFSAGKAFD